MLTTKPSHPFLLLLPEPCVYSQSFGFSPSGLCRLALRPMAKGSVASADTASAAIAIWRCRMRRRMRICRRKSIERSPPAKIPMARKARTSAGEPVLENRPEGLEPSGVEDAVGAEPEAELVVGIEPPGVPVGGRRVIADGVVILNRSARASCQNVDAGCSHGRWREGMKCVGAKRPHSSLLSTTHLQMFSTFQNSFGLHRA